MTRQMIRPKFQPSIYSSYGADEPTDQESPPTGETPSDSETTAPPEEQIPPKESRPYSKYAEVARKLLGWDKTKAMEVAVLESRLHALLEGDPAAKLQAQIESGQVSREQAILKTKQLLTVAKQEAAQETLRNVSFTALVVGGGLFAFASVGLVGAKFINQVQQARLTQAQIKQIRGN
jgi:hypothetical protein